MADDNEAFLKVYRQSLENLVINSKLIINNLTLLADKNRESAGQIVRTIEARLNQVQGQQKMPVIYLLDSITKNVGGIYIETFSQNLVSTFCTVFEQADDQMRRDLYKLRQTWGSYYPPKKLYNIDVRVNRIDTNWPITASSGSIHVNPKFLSKDGPPSRRIVEVLERPRQKANEQPKETSSSRKNHVVVDKDHGSHRWEWEPEKKRQRRNDVDDENGEKQREREKDREHRHAHSTTAGSSGRAPPSELSRLSSDHQSILRHLLLMPYERLLDNEDFVLTQAQRLHETGCLSNKEIHRLDQMLKELYRQQQDREMHRKQNNVRAASKRPLLPDPVDPRSHHSASAQTSQEQPLARHYPSHQQPAAPPSALVAPRRLMDPAEEETLLRRHQELKRQEEDMARQQREEEVAWRKRQEVLAKVQKQRVEMQEDYPPNAQRKTLMSKPMKTSALQQTNSTSASGSSEVADQVKPHMASTVTDLFKRLLQSGILMQMSNQAKVVGAKEKVPLPLIHLIPSELKEPLSAVVESLHAGQQCSSCGLRFIGIKTGEYDAHLDWHFKVNRREKTNKVISRKWMIPAEDWVKFIDYDKLEDTARSTVFDMELEEAKPKEEKTVSCPVLSDEDEVCPICNEAFEQFWHEESEEWHFKDAVRVDNQVYHVACHEDAKEQPAEDPSS